jgi:hypothetical protein
MSSSQEKTNALKRKSLPFWMHLFYGFIGACTGLLSYVPFAIFFFFLAVLITNPPEILGKYFQVKAYFLFPHKNTDDFLAIYLCFIPAAICAFVFGLIGGLIYKKREKEPLTGATLGGAAASIITLLLMTARIMKGWMSR